MWYPGNLIFHEPRKEEKPKTFNLENIIQSSTVIVPDLRLYEVLNGRVHDSKSKRLARKK